MGYIMDGLGYEPQDNGKALVPGIPTQYEASLIAAAFSNDPSFGWTDTTIPEKATFEQLIDKALMRVPWVWACVSFIADQIATLPYRSVVNNRFGEKEEEKSGPLVDLLHSPNPSWSWEDMVTYQAISNEMSGKQYFLLTGIGDHITDTERPRGIWPLPYKATTIHAGKRFGEVARYEYRGAQAPMMEYQPHEVVMVRSYPHPLDPLNSMSPAEAGFLSTEKYRSAGEWLKKMLQKRNARPDIAWSAKQRVEMNVLEKTAEMVQKMVKTDSGHLFSNDFTPEKLSYSPLDMGVTNIEESSKVEVCAVFRVPPMLVGDLQYSTMENFKHAMRYVMMYNILPKAKKMVNALNRRIDPVMPGNAYFDIDEGAIDALQDDENERVKRQTMQVASAIKTPNEIRADNGDESLGDIGDKPLASSTLELLELIVGGTEKP